MYMKIVSACSLILFCVLQACSSWSANYEWNGSAGDNLWSTAANWTPGTVPGAADSALIPGATPELIISAATAVSVLTIESSAVVRLRGAALSVETLNNGGLFAVESGTASPTLPSTIFLNNTGTLRVYAKDSSLEFVITNGFTNTGTIELSSSYWTGNDINTTLTISSGTLINNGLILANVPAQGGGPRIINAVLINNGILQVADPGAVTKGYELRITNSGRIFTNSGELAVPDGKKIIVNDGTTILGSGTTLTGAGTGVLELTGTHILELPADLTLLPNTTSLFFSGNVTVNGAGVLTNQGSLLLENEVINAPLINSGTGVLTIQPGTTSINGTFSNEADATLVVYGKGSSVRLNVANSFINNGLIRLTSYYFSGNGPNAVMAVAGGMTNNGVINSEIGYRLGDRRIIGNVLNAGEIGGDHTLTVEGTLTLPSASITALTILPQYTYGSVQASSQPLILNGTLNVTFDPAYTPSVGDSFDVIKTPASGLSNSFTTMNLPDPGTGKIWKTSQVSNKLTLSIVNSYTVGGSVSGLTGSNLVLQNNAGDDLPISADGAFTFGTAVADGSIYDVSVLTQPNTPDQICTVTSGSGTVAGANVDTVAITCVNTYTIGGTVSGLAGSNLVLQNNAGDNLSVAADGSFTFYTAIADGNTYFVTVLNQPDTPNQTCLITAGSGTLSGADIDTVNITCTTNTYNIGGTVSGLAAGNSVVLQNNAWDNLSVAADGSFTFYTAIEDGTIYSVTVLTQPDTPNQTCIVTKESGTLTGVDVDTVKVTCTTNTYSIGGTVSGLAAGNSVVLQNNAGDDLFVDANGSFTFVTHLPDTSAYSVAILPQPTTPGQECLVSNNFGTIAGANITDVAVVCTDNKFQWNLFLPAIIGN